MLTLLKLNIFMKPTIVQKIKVEMPDKATLAFAYYSMINTLNGIGLTKRDLEWLSYYGVNNEDATKKEFCKIYNTSEQTASNIVSKLFKKGIVYKDGRRVKIVDSLSLDFNKNVMLAIQILSKDEFE